jgi:hypothetical protein
MVVMELRLISRRHAELTENSWIRRPGKVRVHGTSQGKQRLEPNFSILEQPVNRCFSQAPGVLAGRLSVFPRCSAPDAFLPLENANSSRRGSEQCCCGAQRRQARATNRRARYCPAAQPAHTDSRHAAAAAAIPCSFPRWCQHALCIRHVRPLQLPGH